MSDPAFQALLRSIRRRLWLRRAADAARRSLWISAALMVVASIATVALGHLPSLAIAASATLVWAATLGWAAARRPSLADSALWADRHLQGRSAFGTLLELEQGSAAVADTAVRRHLQVWAVAQLAHSRRLLDERREPLRLSAPLLALLVCGALAALMQALFSAPTSSEAKPSVSAVHGAAAASTAAARAADEPSPTMLQGEAPAAGPPPADRRAPGAASPGMPDTALASAASRPHRDDPAAFNPLSGTDAPASAAAATAATTSAPAADLPASEGGGSGTTGRQAGDARDEARTSAATRPASAALPTQWSDAARRRTGPGQADSGEAATYDDTATRSGLEPARTPAAVKAAAPPTATETTRLTPIETEYVQAWMRARTPSR
jgi:hypothetical protein